MRAGVGLPSIWSHLNRQVYLGDEAFVARMQRKAVTPRGDASEIPRAQRVSPRKPLGHYTQLKLSRERAMARVVPNRELGVLIHEVVPRHERISLYLPEVLHPYRSIGRQLAQVRLLRR